MKWFPLVFLCLLVPGFGLWGQVEPFPEEHVTPGVSTVPGSVTTDWIGNTFGMGELINPGASTTDDFNRKWVQNFCENAWVSADGRVYTHSHWDEGSRAGGIYQNGDVVGQLASPTKVVFARDGAIVGDGSYIYATSVIDWTNWRREGFGIRRFHMNGSSAPWDEGEGYANSYLVITETGEPPLPARLAIDPSRNELFVLTTDAVLVFSTLTMSKTPVATIPLEVNPVDPEAARLHDMVSDRAGKLWIMRTKNLIERTDHRLISDGLTISGDFGANPRLSMAHDGRLMVWDDKLLQVRFYTHPGTAQQSVSTFGAEGGIYSGVRGQRQPDKLLPRATSLGTDAEGNLYMTWGSAVPPSFTEVRSWTPQGEMRWEVMSHLFVHCGGFDRASDGNEIFTTQTRYTMDYRQPAGKKWTYASFLWDREDEPQIPAIGGGVIVRWLDGKRVVAKSAADLGSDGFRFYIDNQESLKRVDGKFGAWAWWFDSNGDVWEGDAKINGVEVIVRYPFTGWVDGEPTWNWNNPQTWPRPTGYPINRIHYEPDSDILIVTGGSSPGDWGRAGLRMTRFNGWRHGDQTVAWDINLPHDSINNTMQVDYFKALWVEADYIFLAATASSPRAIHVYRVSDGIRIGRIVPGPEVAGDVNIGGEWGRHGWIDMVWGVQALKRQNGSYVILLEDDMNAKNNLYTWYPEDIEPPPSSQIIDELGESIPAFRSSIHQAKVEDVGGFSLSGDSTKAVPLTTTTPGTITWRVGRVESVTATVGIRTGEPASFALETSSNGVDFTPLAGTSTAGETGEHWRVWTYQYGSIPSGTTHFRATLSAVGCRDFWDITLGRIAFNLSGNEPPVLAPVGATSIQVGRELRFQISATDADDNALTFSASGGQP
jgi:hypothetical protein